jgi:DNA modification methylase
MKIANYLYYGDNLDNLRKYVKDETVDLCYIDPPFNSKRTYNQIYNNIGKEDRAQAQAFVDTWTWDEQAAEGYEEILCNDKARYVVQTVELIKGLANVLGKGSLLAYLVSMTRRIAEIRRVLRPTGSFYFHCDPTSSHYLKVLTDGIFCSQGGDFRNEVIWYYYNKMHDSRKRLFPHATDTLLFYVKDASADFTYRQLKEPRPVPVKQLARKKVDGRMVNAKDEDGHVIYRLKEDRTIDNVWRIPCIQPADKTQRMGFQTQKPEALLERVISASSNEGDTVLDAYCGCGTTVAVAQRLSRNWIGMDITYQSISLILKRLEGAFGKGVADAVKLAGQPQDMDSAYKLANKKDDRLRKEFEKWAVLTYTDNRGSVNEKKDADAGIDGYAYFRTGKDENDRMVFQVKSGKVSRGDIAKLNSDRQREGAALATLITLEDATGPMQKEAKDAGVYTHAFTGAKHNCVSIVTVREMIEERKRIDLPLSLDAVSAPPSKKPGSEQRRLDLDRIGHYQTIDTGNDGGYYI